LASIVSTGRTCLASGDHERGVVRAGVEDRPHPIADARRRVEVYQRGRARRLGISIRGPNRHRLLEAEHVAEVLGKLGQHRQLGRAGVPEHGRHPVGARKSSKLASRTVVIALALYVTRDRGPEPRHRPM
jgi:hypothetical protein